MVDMWSSEGTGLLAALFLGLQLISLILLIVMLGEYRHIKRKRLLLVQAMASTAPKPWGMRTHAMQIIYIVLTLLSTLGMLYLFFFQPHLL